ncbi:MAG: hypothetical protein QXJ17_01670 [Nitrososphaeria archaeon]
MDTQAKRRFELAAIILSIIIMFTILVMHYALTNRNELGAVPRYEKLTLKNIYQSPTQVKLLVKNTGSFTDAKITCILVDRSLLSAMNGTSDPETPFILKDGDSETITLSFGSPLVSGKTYKIIICAEQGDYDVNVTIP